MFKTPSNLIKITILLFIFCSEKPIFSQVQNDDDSLLTVNQMQIAQIIDKDGYTNIRNGKGISYEILGTFNDNDLFYCEVSDTTDWYKVIGNRRAQIKGFMHKSRIEIIQELSTEKQKRIIIKNLESQKQLADDFTDAFSKYDREKNKWNSLEDSMNYQITRKELENNEINYSSILKILPQYFCKSKDKQVIQLFFDTMWANSGSASELPTYSIADCFVCESELIIELLKQIDNQEKKMMIAEHISFGLMNAFYIEGKDQSDNPTYIKLQAKLDRLD